MHLDNLIQIREGKMSSKIDFDAILSGVEGKQLIESGKPARCEICWHVFERISLTYRYCHQCKAGICDGTHGNYENGRWLCLACNPKAGKKGN